MFLISEENKLPLHVSQGLKNILNLNKGVLIMSHDVVLVKQRKKISLCTAK